MEMDEKADTAESCSQWFKNPRSQVSAHYCVDVDSVVQCVKEEDVAWHAPGANHNGLGFEHAGTAAQTPAQWSDPYSETLLALSRWCTAGWGVVLIAIAVVARGWGSVFTAGLTVA